MKLSRRTTLLAAGLLAVLPFAAPATAQSEFPHKPVKIIIGFGAGGASDTVARIYAAKMSEVLGEQVIVENQPGNSTNIAAVAVKEAEPDGYTLFMAGNSNAVNPSLRENVPIDILNDFEPIALFASVPNILAVRPSLGVDSVPELIELAKSSPDGLFFGSSGVGSVSHLSGEYLKSQTGANLIHVPYKGSAAAMNDLLSGAIDFMFVARSTVEPHVKEGSLVALASSTAERPKGLEDLPTVSEAGIDGFDAKIWFGIVAPAGTPDDVIAKLADAVEQAQADPKLQEQLANQGVDIFRGDSDAYWAYMKGEMDKWAEIVKSAGIEAN
jgi:tripartite-type tricarboxylate transporter receptor subunit TctC